MAYLTVDEGARTKHSMAPIDSGGSKATTLTAVDGSHVKMEFTSVDGRTSVVWEGDITSERDNLPLITSTTWRNATNDCFWGLSFGTPAGVAEINGAPVATTDWTDTQVFFATSVIDAATEPDVPFELALTTSDGRKRTFKLSKPPPNGIVIVRKMAEEDRFVIEGNGFGYDRGVTPTPSEISWSGGGPGQLMTMAVDCDNLRVTTNGGAPLDAPVTVTFKSFTWDGSISSTTDLFTAPAVDDIYWDASGDVDFYGSQFHGEDLVVKLYGKTLAIPGGVGPYFTIPAAEWADMIVDDQPFFLEMNNGIATAMYKLERPPGGSPLSRKRFRSRHDKPR